LLIFEDGYVKLSDFGLSKQLDPNQKYYMKVGTQDYFAPELVMGGECTTHIDLWALGVVAYELSNYVYPFKS
jgi:serine/threonine protein kinase